MLAELTVYRYTWNVACLISNITADATTCTSWGDIDPSKWSFRSRAATALCCCCSSSSSCSFNLCLCPPRLALAFNFGMVGAARMQQLLAKSALSFCKCLFKGSSNWSGKTTRTTGNYRNKYAVIQNSSPMECTYILFSLFGIVSCPPPPPTPPLGPPIQYPQVFLGLAEPPSLMGRLKQVSR